MASYRVAARRAHEGWSLHTPHGDVQASSLSVGKKLARERIAAETGVPVSAVEVVLAPKLPIDVGAEVAAARDAAAELAALQTSVAARSRQIAGRLRELGLSNADVAVVLGVSEQRVSQLLPKVVQSA